MKARNLSLFVLASALCAQSFAQEVQHRLGDHPAVIVKRLEASKGYDYQAQFYPHPAWMYLQAEAPHTLNEHPAVVIARRAREDAARAAALAAQKDLDASIP
jgi:N-acyl-D-aspartate/D-glutamate deacylase